jgi:hypothetical protein
MTSKKVVPTIEVEEKLIETAIETLGKLNMANNVTSFNISWDTVFISEGQIKLLPCISVQFKRD